MGEDEMDGGAQAQCAGAEGLPRRWGWSSVNVTAVSGIQGPAWCGCARRPDCRAAWHRWTRTGLAQPGAGVNGDPSMGRSHSSHWPMYTLVGRGEGRGGDRSRRGRERGRKEGGWERGGAASKIKEGAVRSGASWRMLQWKERCGAGQIKDGQGSGRGTRPSRREGEQGGQRGPLGQGATSPGHEGSGEWGGKACSRLGKKAGSHV